MKKVINMGLVLLCGISLGACGDSSRQDKTDGKATAKTETTIESSKQESSASSESSSKADSNLLIDSEYKKIATNSGAENAILIGEKTYSCDWSDNSWNGVNLSIDKVSVIKTDNYEDYSGNTAEGFIVIHWNIDNTQSDITIYPEQATVNTNTGVQTEGMYEMEHFAGDLMKGTKVSGNAAYALSTLNSVDDITSIRALFYGTYETDDWDDENAHHDYDVSFDLK